MHRRAIIDLQHCTHRTRITVPLRPPYILFQMVQCLPGSPGILSRSNKLTCKILRSEELYNMSQLTRYVYASKPATGVAVLLTVASGCFFSDHIVQVRGHKHVPTVTHNVLSCYLHHTFVFKREEKAHLFRDQANEFLSQDEGKKVKIALATFMKTKVRLLYDDDVFSIVEKEENQRASEHVRHVTSLRKRKKIEEV